MLGIVIYDRDILGGEPVFLETRVPFKILIEYLEGGDTLDQFLSRKPLSGWRSELGAQCASVGAGVPSDHFSTRIMNTVTGSGAP
jgi:hypothetical protein